MGSKDQYSTHLDGELKAAVEELREREGGDDKAPKSQALRTIVRDWSRESEQQDNLPDAMSNIGTAVMVGAVVFAMLGVMLPAITYFETLAGTSILAIAGGLPILVASRGEFW